MKTVRNALFVTATLFFVLLVIPVSAQNASDPSDSWNSNTSLQDQSGNTNPTRVTQSHRKENGRQIDVQTLETKGINGGSQVY